MDAQPGAFRDHQQLGVEEPAGVVDQRQQLARDVGAHGLEAALRIGEPRTEHAAQDQVVTARDEFALRPRTTRDDAANREPIATSEWPEISGATSGINADRSVDRSTSM